VKSGRSSFLSVFIILQKIYGLESANRDNSPMALLHFLGYKDIDNLLITKISLPLPLEQQRYG
jgi:hypothetical protein